MRIRLVVDTSGSMQEWGKKQASMHLTCALKQACKLLGCTCQVLDLKDLKEAENLPNSVLISDGLFERPGFKVHVCIALGVDANKGRLAQMSRACYEPENVLRALDRVLLDCGLLDESMG